MDYKQATAYRDLTDAEIIALAETRVCLVHYGCVWVWLETGRDYDLNSETLPCFMTKLDAADDAVCELGLDDLSLGRLT